MNEPSLAAAISAGECNFAVIVIREGLGDAVLALPLIRFVASKIRNRKFLIWGRTSYAKTVFSEFSDCFVPMADDWKSLSFGDAKRELTFLRKRIPHGANIGWVSLNSYPSVPAEHTAIELLEVTRVWRWRPTIRWNCEGVEPIRRSDQYFRVIGEKAMDPVIDRRPHIQEVTLETGMRYRRAARNEGKLLLAIHGEPSTKEKMWPVESWASLLSAIRKTIYPVVLESDKRRLESLTDVCVESASDWCRQSGVVAAADLFIGIDSSWAHVADTFDIPGIVLFRGPTISQWKPRNSQLEGIIAPDGAMGSIVPSVVLARLLGHIKNIREGELPFSMTGFDVR